MSPIPQINIQKVNIQTVPNVYVPSWMVTQPTVDYLLPPVVVNIGNPIVNIPGCVKAHKDNKRHKNNIPIDKNLVEDDPNQAMTLCPDGSYPTYDAMNYEPEQLVMTYEQKAPPVAPPPEPPGTPETPETPKIPKEEVLCPGPNQRRIGDLTQDGSEKVVGHELSEDKQTCIVLYEPTTPVEKFLPTANIVTTTATIAAVATASAIFAKPLADLLLRVFKPAIKQATAKVQKMLGKVEAKPSRNEIIADEYRKKKGLPPFKDTLKKMKKKK